MRVITVAEAGGDGTRVELHPLVTVVTGLDPDRRSWLMAALGGLAAGGSTSATGTLEAHGIRFQLSPATLGLLDLGSPVDAVVTASDLPGHDPALEIATRVRDAARAEWDRSSAIMARCRAALTAAVQERDEAKFMLEELLSGGGAARAAIEAAAAERVRLETELLGARTERDEAQAALDAAVAEQDRAEADFRAHAGRVEAARFARQHAIDEAAAAAAALEQARSGVADEQQLAAAVAEARAALAAAESAAGSADPGGDDSPVNRRLADLERRRAEIGRMQLAIGPDSGDEVSAALDAVLSADGAGPNVEAVALADTWRDLYQQINALDAGVPTDERAAEERVARCRQALLEAEADFNQPVLTPDEIAKVEAAHAATLEAQDKADSRFGGSRARKRLDEARAEESRVLERLGFSAYADYMMSAANRGSAPANRSLVEAARNLLEAAEAELAAIPGAGDRARRRLELLQRREELVPQVVEMLGHEPTGAEAEAELRALRAPSEPDPAALGALARALTAAGIDPGPEPHEQEDLVLLARSYLAEERAAGEQRGDAETAIEALDDQIAILRDARTRGTTELPDLPALPALAEPQDADAALPASHEDEADRLLREARWAEVESARLRLEMAQTEADRAREDRAHLAELEAALVDATAEEARLAAELAELEAEAGSGGPDATARAAVAAAADRLQRATARVEDLSASLTALQGSSGAEPLVTAARARLTAADTALSLAAAEEQRAAAVQVEADAALAAAEIAVSDAEQRVRSVDRSQLVSDVDWLLLTRLAAVRSVGLAGSVPLVLDDPFGSLDAAEVPGVLTRMSRLAGAVQVVVLSDDATVVDWARSAGADRARVLAA